MCLPIEDCKLYRALFTLNMYNLLVVCCFVGIRWAESISTYNMEEQCNKKLSFIFATLYQTRVTYNYEPWNNPPTCAFAVESWYYQPKLMFYFEDLDFDCSEGTLRISGEYDSPLTGLDFDICGTKPAGVYTSLDRLVKISFTPKNNNLDTYESKEYFKIIFTSFHTGSCESYEYKCDNGRCIDDDLSCNGFNSCGDDSDCRTHGLSAGIIAGIVIGCIIVIGGIIFVAVLVWMCNRKRPVQNPWSATTIAPTTGQPLTTTGGAPYPQAPYPHAVQHQYQHPQNSQQQHVQYQQAGVGQYPKSVTEPTAPLAMPPPSYGEAVDMSNPVDGQNVTQM